jgi:hypothetical protein
VKSAKTDGLKLDQDNGVTSVIHQIKTSIKNAHHLEKLVSAIAWKA